MRVKLPPLHRKQDEIRRSPARFKVVACGRRFGKTMLGVLLALSCALGGGAVWWVGPTSREAGIGWRAMRGIAQQIPGTHIKVASKQIHFPGGGWVAVLSAQSQTLRGEGLDLLIIDEAAFLPDLTKVWQEDLRATLSDRKGKALFISSPAGRNGFFDLWLRGQQGNGEWASWQAPTYDNPFIARAEIDAAQAELPEWVFRQEYLAEFVTFAGKVYKQFDPHGPCVFADRKASGSDEHWGGIDFGFRNPTVVSVGAINRDDVLDVVDGTYARSMTTDDLIAILLDYQQRYHVRMWYCDPSEPGDIQTMKRAGVRAVGCPRVTGGKSTSSVRQGCIEVETRLVQGRLRIASHLRDHIREMDMYRYPDGSETRGENEAPLKVDDHAPDSLRYMVVGVNHARRRLGNVVVV